jgi:YHS domain-containing protein
MPGAESSDQAQERLRYCANCGKPLVTAPLEYWEYAGRIQLFCSQRCYDRFTTDPARRLIASPRGES